MDATVSKLYVSKTQPALEVVKGIASLGELDSLDANVVTEIRKAYQALSAADKAMVTNIAVLDAAEAHLKQVQYVHAEFNTSAMTFDGTLNEASYRNYIKINDSVKLTTSWNGKYLYLGFAGTTAAVAELKLGVDAVTYESKAGTNSIEYRIPLDLPDYSKAYTLSFKLGETLWSGMLVFDTVAYATKAPDKIVNFGAEPSASGWDTTDKWSVVLNTFASTATSGSYAETNQKWRDMFNPTMANLVSSLSKDTVIELDLKLDYLPDVNPSLGETGGTRDQMTGVNIAVVDDENLSNSGTTYTEGMWSGLYQSGGKLYFAYWDRALDTGVGYALLGDYVAGGEYHLRIEYHYTDNSAQNTEKNITDNDIVSAKYYINGKLVAESANAKRMDVEFTSSTPNAILITARGSASTNESRVDATVSKLYVSKTNPAVYEGLVSIKDVERFISEIDATVTLDSENAIKKARDAYDALDAQVKVLVSNLAVLEAAEMQLKVLKNCYLHAVYSVSKITADGNVNEAVYKRVLPLSGTLNVSAAWDATNLYLAFAGAATPNVTVLKVNGYNVDLTASKTGTGTREIAIALDSVGMGAYRGEFPISFQVDGKTWSGKLVLDTVDHEVAQHGDASWAATSLDDRTGFTLDTWAKDQSNGNTYRSIVVYNNDKLAAVAGADSVMEFDLEPTFLPENSAATDIPYRFFLNGGISVTVRDDKDPRASASDRGQEAFLFGFGKVDGEMRLYYWYFDAAAQTNKCATVAMPQSDKYHVRVEYTYGADKDVTAKYYINGILILEKDASRVIGNRNQVFDFSTAALNCAQFYAGVESGKQSETNKVLATIRNVSFGHTTPNLYQEMTVDVEQVEQLIDAIGEVTMDRAGYIESTLARFNSLSAFAQKLVKNADVLKSAVAKLKQLEGSFLHAAFAATSVVVDGKADEEIFRRSLSLGKTKFGAAWDAKYLYLYFADAAAPTVDKLTINNVNVNTTGVAGTAAREIKIALADLGITNLNNTYPIFVQIGNHTWSGKLVLDNVDFGSVPYGVLSWGATGSSDRLSFVLDTLNPDVNGANNYRSTVAVNSEKLAYMPGTSTVLEIGFDPTYMPDNCTIANIIDRAFLTGGMGVSVRDDQDIQTEAGPDGKIPVGTKGFLFGFGKVNGELKLIHWYMDAANKGKYAVVDIPQVDGQQYVRVEYSYSAGGEVVSAKYYVNGLLVVEADNARLEGGSFSTSQGNVLQFYTGVSGKASATNRVEVAVNSVSIGHGYPELNSQVANDVPKVVALINAIGTVTKESKKAVQAAQAAYESLCALAQTQVSNAKTLEAAVARMQMLENSYLHAAFTYDGLTLDGKILETAYKLNIHMSEKLRVGAVWTKDYLYLAFQGDTPPTVSKLVINGKAISITSSNSKTGATSREVRLSLSSLGIVGYDKTYPISFRVGNIDWNGTLVQDSNDYEAQRVYTMYYGTTGSSDKKTIMLNTVIPDENGANTTRSLALFNGVKFASAPGKISIFDMDVEIANLPYNSTTASTPSREFITNGVTFTLRDDLSPAVNGYAREAFNFGFGKQNGKLKLYYWYNDAEGKAQLATVDVPEATSYHLRIELSNGNGKVTSAKYFVNGILLSEANSVRVAAGSFGTSMDNCIQVYAKASASTEAGRVELRLSGVSLSHPQKLIIDDKSAAEYVDELIMNIGTVTMENAELINVAREAYNGLTAAQKKLVTKLSVLEAAEKTLRALKDQYNAQYTNYVFAQYYTKEMLIDGELKEVIWRTPQPIFDAGYLGLTWDFDYLYLGLTGSKINTLSNLKINGKPVTNLGVTSTNSREIKILLSSVGIREINFKASYDLSFTLDGKTWNGKIVFDTGSFAAVKPATAFWGATRNNYHALFNTLNSTQDGKRVGMIWNTNNLNSTNGTTTIFEADVQVNAMPNNGSAYAVSRNFPLGGFGFTIRDDDMTMGDTGYGCEAFMVGLMRQKGQMKLIYWDDSIDDFVYESVEDYGTGKYHLRIEYFYYTNNEVSAKYYVNGMLVAETLDAKEVASNNDFSTGTANNIQGVAFGTDEGHVDVVISNLSVTHNRELEAPEPLDALTKDEVFGKLDLNHVQNDLNLPKEFVTVNGERFDLVWTTSDSSVITNEGKVTRPLEDPATVTLTVVVDGKELWSVTVKVDPMSLEEFESAENVDAAFSKDPIVIDGVLEEQGWRMGGRVLDKNKQLYAEYGFQWTQTHLYIAVEYIRNLDTLSFKLNGRYYTVQNGKLYRGGVNVGGSTLIATNGNVIELRIPLSVLGLPSNINYYGVNMPMSIKAGPYVGNGKVLTLSGISWFVTGNREHEPVGAGISSNDAYHGIQKLINGYRLYDLYGGSNAAMIRSYVSFMNTEEYIENFADRTYDTRIEFDFQADALPILPTDGSAYTGNGGARGVSGFTCCAGEILGADNYSLSFNYGIINTVDGLLFVLNVSGVIHTQILNKEVGDKFSIAVEWTKEDTLKLFVDGVHLNTFNCTGHWDASVANASLVVNMCPLFAPNSVADNYDVSITNLAFGKVHNEIGILEQIAFEDIRGGNRLPNAISADLTLPNSITNGQLDKTYGITWTSSDPSVISHDGKVTRPAKGIAPVTLTAKLANGETKTFDLTVYGLRVENDGVLYVENDENPAQGVGLNSNSREFTLDATNNSIIKILDGVKKINFVVLTDGDDKADLTPETTTLWVSNDNQTYTRIKDYKMLQVGNKWYLYDFEAECRYVKVHYTKPDEGEESTFIGTYGEMIDADYETVFGGGNATFTESTYVLTNKTGKDQQDYAWTISKAALGITGNDASIRIFADGKLLYHYVSGSNVVVRVNELAAGASVTLTALSSNSTNVMDISNKEGVHEVIYGVQNSTLFILKWHYLTLPAGTVFPDGSKLEQETIYAMATDRIRVSTDGGKTWKNGTVLNNAPEGKEPVKGVSLGGWIFDSKTGRMMYQSYVRGGKPTEGAFNANNMEDSHMHTYVINSDDGGKTWYQQATLPCRTCMPAYKGNLNIPTYALSYSDGFEVSTNDGKGPNVDFVFTVGTQYDNIGSFACRVAYTRDGGETWHYSTTPITYPTQYGAEGGCSEGWIMEREDGVLVLHVRAQDKGNYHFKMSYSYDHGLTWTNDNIFTNFYAVNGQAFVRRMEIAGEDTIIAAWGGNTSLGNVSYHRNPFVFASSANDGETFRNIQNIYFRSFEEKYENVWSSETTNVSLVSHSDGDLLFTYKKWTGDWLITHVEDFDLWFTRTKGAYDNFEKGTLRGEGWNKVGIDVVEITDEIARDKYSLKIGSEAMAIRSIPYLQDGTMSIDIYVAAGSDFTMELQSAHTRYYDQVSVPIAFRVEDGKVYFNSSTTASADGIKEGWNTLVFNLGLSDGEATLSINGGKAVDIPLKMDFDDYINYINIAAMHGTTVYVDEFMVISETVTDLSTDEADQKAADKVIALIKAIKNAGDTAAIKAAREAFDKLTLAQQDLVNRRVLANNGKSGLDGMINYYEVLRMYEDGDLITEKLINEIGTVDENSGEKLEAAEAAYKQLTYAQKQKVDNYGTLRLARLRYDRIMAHKAVADANAAKEVQEMIDAILLANPMRYETKIAAARKAYNKLSADQMALVDNRNLAEGEKKLKEQKEEFTRKSLVSLQKLIDTLDNVGLRDLALVEGIRMKINSLTSEQKQTLDDRKLVMAEQKLGELKTGVDKKVLNQYRLEGVIRLINSIGQVTPEKKGLIDAIRNSYNKLTVEQQELVTNYTELVKAEALVTTQLQIADLVPNTSDNTPTAIASTPVMMPMMLFGILALAVLVVLYFKKRNYR